MILERLFRRLPRFFNKKDSFASVISFKGWTYDIIGQDLHINNAVINLGLYTIEELVAKLKKIGVTNAKLTNALYKTVNAKIFVR